ncbi:MAG: type II toxin-antitoxin system VapC family toxin [Clostridiales Family XIII bacterium]|nr:type II toxin-antitoxin system VapC family toxin [Clostridiales Family XIII bacterium]
MLDTNICIYLIREKSEKVLEKYKEQKIGEVVISVVTLAELEFGVQNSSSTEKSANALSNFLVGVDVLDFTAKAAQEYSFVRANLKKKRTTIGPFDTLIAAHAMAEGCTLVTNNTGEFERVDGLSIIDWTM